MFPIRFQRVTKRGEILDFGSEALGSNLQDWAGFLTVNWGAGENDLQGVSWRILGDELQTCHRAGPVLAVSEPFWLLSPVQCSVLSYS